MAARINTKFLLILFIAISVAAGLVGGLWFIQVRGDASRQARLGDQMMDEGSYYQASQHYARAVQREPANREFLQKLEVAVTSVRPETTDMAREMYERLRFVLMHEARIDSSNPDAHLRYIREVDRNAELLATVMPASGVRGLWQELYSAADDMCDRVAEDDPQHPYCLFYRGKAISNQHSFVRVEELEAAKEDLEGFLEAFPESDEGRAVWLLYWANLYEQLRPMDATTRTQEVRNRLQEESERAAEEDLGGPLTQLFLVRQRLVGFAEGSETASEGELARLQQWAMDIADEAERTGNPIVIHRAASTLLQFNEPFMQSRAASLYRSYVEENPDNLLIGILYAQALFLQQEIDDASAIAREILDGELLTVSFVAQLQRDIRRIASQLLFEMTYQKLGRISGDPEMKETIEKAKGYRDRLAEYVGDDEDDPQLMRADAKLAIARGETRTALDLLERLVRRGGSDAELLTLASAVLEESGQMGLALNRITAAMDGLSAPPAALWWRKARLQYRLGRHEAAAESIQNYLRTQPDSPRGLQLSNAIQAALQGETYQSDQPDFLAIQAAEEAMQRGDMDAARDAIFGALESDPENIALLSAAARLEMVSERLDRAREYVDRGLAVAPNNANLRQLDVILESDDPVERVIRYFRETEESETDAIVLTGINLYSLAASQRRLAEQSADESQADALRTNAQRAEREANEYLARARERAADDARLIEFEFNRALLARDWNRAEAIADRARRANIDRADGLLFRARISLERGDYEEAVRVFIRATDRQPYSSQIWRGLGMAYHRVGNVEEAVRSLEEAYRINPNDLNTIQQLGQVLVQSGDTVRALRMIEEARRVFRDNPRIWNLWLTLENEAGSRETVLRERRRRHRENPEDVENTSALATFLARTSPRRGLLLDENLQPRYGATAWSRMTSTEQQRVLEEEKKRWNEESERIVQETIDREGKNIDNISMMALVHRLRGDVRGGERVLREYIEEVEEAEGANLNYRIVLSRYQQQTGQLDRAFQTLVEARDEQDPDRLQIDRALADFLFQQNRHEQAVSLYEAVLEVDPSFEVHLRLVECLVRLRQFDRAESRLEQAMADRDPVYSASMLRALIALGRAEDAAMRGDVAQAEQYYQRQRDALERAQRLSPSDPTPHVFRAQSLLGEFQRTGSADLLDRAMSALSRADAVQMNHPRTGLVRAQVHLARQNESAALSELERLLERFPDEVQSRRLIVDLQLRRGNTRAAIDHVEEAIRIYPTSVSWYEQLAAIYAQRNERGRVLEIYERAWNATRSPAILRSYVAQLLTGSQPDSRRVMSMLADRREMRDADPILDAHFARAQYMQNNEPQGRRSLERSYRKLRTQVAQHQRGAQDLQAWLQVAQPMLAQDGPEAFESALREWSGEEELHASELMWIARMWAGSGDSGLPKALDMARRAVEQSDSESPRFRAGMKYDLSLLHYLQDEHDLAIEMLDQVLELDPDHARAHNNKAFILTEYKKEPSRAVFHARRAVELMRQDHAALDTLGWTYYHIGDLEQARAYLEQSLEIRRTATTLFHLAHVLKDEGREEAAVTHLRQALELDPSPDDRIRIESFMLEIDQTAAVGS